LSWWAVVTKITSVICPSAANSNSIKAIEFLVSLVGGLLPLFSQYRTDRG
jgi:hypothetical protein